MTLSQLTTIDKLKVVIVFLLYKVDAEVGEQFARLTIEIIQRHLVCPRIFNCECSFMWKTSLLLFQVVILLRIITERIIFASKQKGLPHIHFVVEQSCLFSM